MPRQPLNQRCPMENRSATVLTRWTGWSYLVPWVHDPVPLGWEGWKGTWSKGGQSSHLLQDKHLSWTNHTLLSKALHWPTPSEEATRHASAAESPAVEKGLKTWQWAECQVRAGSSIGQTLREAETSRGRRGRRHPQGHPVSQELLHSNSRCPSLNSLHSRDSSGISVVCNQDCVLFQLSW